MLDEDDDDDDDLAKDFIEELGDAELIPDYDDVDQEDGGPEDDQDEEEEGDESVEIGDGRGGDGGKVALNKSELRQLFDFGGNGGGGSRSTAESDGGVGNY